MCMEPPAPCARGSVTHNCDVAPALKVVSREICCCIGQGCPLTMLRIEMHIRMQTGKIKVFKCQICDSMKVYDLGGGGGVSKNRQRNYQFPS